MPTTYRVADESSVSPANTHLTAMTTGSALDKGGMRYFPTSAAQEGVGLLRVETPWLT